MRQSVLIRCWTRLLLGANSNSSLVYLQCMLRPQRNSQDHQSFHGFRIVCGHSAESSRRVSKHCFKVTLPFSHKPSYGSRVYQQLTPGGLAGKDCLFRSSIGLQICSMNSLLRCYTIYSNDRIRTNGMMTALMSSTSLRNYSSTTLPRDRSYTSCASIPSYVI